MTMVATKPVPVVLMYTLSSEYIKRTLVETGERVESACQEIKGHLSDLPQDQRERLMQVYGGLPGYMLVLRADRNRVSFIKDQEYVNIDLPVADRPFEKLEDGVKWYLDVYLPARKDAEAKEKAANREREERLRAEEEAKKKLWSDRVKQWAAEMERWIAQYGSERLKLGYERGYNVRGLYAKERAAQEFPGFYVDIDGRMLWEERYAPSMAALELETEVRELVQKHGMPPSSVQIVWLTRPPKGLDRDFYFGPREAVLVRGYLEHYNLVTFVSREDAEVPRTAKVSPKAKQRPRAMPGRRTPASLVIGRSPAECPGHADLGGARDAGS